MSSSVGTSISMMREMEDPSFRSSPSRMYDCTRVLGKPLKMNPLTSRDRSSFFSISCTTISSGTSWPLS